MFNKIIDKPHLMAIINDKYYKAFSCKKKPLHYMFRFNDFKLPSLIHLCQNKYFEYSSILFICVDHSFIEEVETYNENINIVFIDHHLAERNGIRYASNAKMMTELYSDLVKDLSDIAPSFQNIVVLMHNDLDGLASGIIMKSILNDIFNDNIDNVKITSGIALAEILGSYGDIDPDKEKLLGKLFNKFDQPNIDKKLESVRKNIGTFFKATRTIHDLLFNIRHINDIKLQEYKTKLVTYKDTVYNYEQYIKQFDIDIDGILLLFYNICESLEKCDKITLKYVIYLMNIILSNKTFIKVNEAYYNVSEQILEQYMGGSSLTPLKFEITAYFEGSNVKYKIIIIDTPFDVARSIMFKYELKVKNCLKQNLAPSNYTYKITDNIKAGKDIIGLSHNIACYNKAINKLTLYSSENSSAYDIASELFHGGGHNTDTGSLGSAVIENENILFDKIKIVDIF